MPGRHGTGRLEDIQRPDKVGVGIGRGVVDAVAHPGLRPHMQHQLRLGGLECRKHCGLVLKLRLNRRETGQSQQHFVPQPLKPHLVIVGKAVEPENLMSLGEQAARQVKPNEASAAGDQDLQSTNSGRGTGTVAD